MKRPKYVTVRLTDDEHHRASTYALKAERPLSDFIRRVLLDRLIDLEVEAMKPFLDPEPETKPEPVDPAAPKSNRTRRPAGTPATPICPECFSTNTIFDWELDGDKFYKCLSCEAINF